MIRAERRVDSASSSWGLSDLARMLAINVTGIPAPSVFLDSSCGLPPPPFCFAPAPCWAEGRVWDPHQGSSRSRDWVHTCVSCTAGGFFTTEPLGAGGGGKEGTDLNSQPIFFCKLTYIGLFPFSILKYTLLWSILWLCVFEVKNVPVSPSIVAMLYLLSIPVTVPKYGHPNLLLQVS